MDILQQYKNDKIAELIKNDELPTEEIKSLTHQIPYKILSQYTFRAPYRHRYHFAEIFNRIMCQERNKPSLAEIDQIESKLSDYSKAAIYKNTNYNQRKHLIYIWQILNKRKALELNEYEFYYKYEAVWNHFDAFYKQYYSRAIKYRLIIDVICERLGFEDIRERLFFKNNLNHRRIVNQALDELSLR